MGYRVGHQVIKDVVEGGSPKKVENHYVIVSIFYYIENCNGRPMQWHAHSAAFWLLDLLVSGHKRVPANVSCAIYLHGCVGPLHWTDHTNSPAIAHSTCCSEEISLGNGSQASFMHYCSYTWNPGHYILYEYTNQALCMKISRKFLS